MKLTREQFVKRVVEETLNANIPIKEDIAEKLYMYKELLIEWNKNINLTAIIDDEEIIVKHILDSLHTVKYIKPGDNLIDVGTGAGLPGIVIAIYFEGRVNVALCDSLNKRIIFLNTVIESLKLDNVVAIHGRAEEQSNDIKYREKYDVVVSRAVAALNVLIELTVPFLKVGGISIYMKAEKAEQEIKNADSAKELLDIELQEVEEYNLKINSEIFKRAIIKYIKKKKTNSRFPRQFSKIKKEPL